MFTPEDIPVIRLDLTRSSDLDRILNRRVFREEILEDARRLFMDVVRRGDEAIRDFYQDFYGLPRDTPIEVLDYEVRSALKKIPKEDLELLERIGLRIKRFNEQVLSTVKKTWLYTIEPGVLACQVVRPLDTVGVYVPGGKYPYPSTALMTVVPARVAGVGRVYAATPPPRGGYREINPYILAALSIAGADKVYRIGGVQAAAAFAVGTETVPRVDKVVGPGGEWFTAGKYLASRYTGIDVLAGPSEIMVLSDGVGDPGLIALDLLAQAEHGVGSPAVFVTTSVEQGLAVRDKIIEWLDEAPEKAREIASKSIRDYGGIVVAEDMEEAIGFVNRYAPEHLEVIVGSEDPWLVLEKIRSAGTVFLGEMSATALGDYSIGTNHVLPTGGFARSRGGLSVLDYVKIIDVQYVGARGLERIGRDASRLAEIEGFFFHKKSVDERLMRAGKR